MMPRRSHKPSAFKCEGLIPSLASFTFNMSIQEINNKIKLLKSEGGSVKDISDTYHTFEELYEFRMLYNALLFNEWAKSYNPNLSGLHSDLVPINKVRCHYNVHKSKRHYDGELCFGGSHFKVSAKLPTGEISNHYKMEYWNLFQIPETEKALFEYDGHTSFDVIDRMKNLLNVNKKY